MNSSREGLKSEFYNLNKERKRKKKGKKQISREKPKENIRKVSPWSDQQSEIPKMKRSMIVNLAFIKFVKGFAQFPFRCVFHSLQQSTILDKNVKKNARFMFNFRILPSKARLTQDTPPSPPKKQCWSVARTFLQPTKQHWPGRGGGRGHHGAKYAGWVSCV